MSIVCFYWVNTQRHSTLITCCTCLIRGAQVQAITPVGVSIRLLWSGWHRLHCDWYTLWQCADCFKRGRLPRPEANASFFAATRPAELIETQVHGFTYARGRRRKHGKEDGTKAELWQLQART